MKWVKVENGIYQSGEYTIKKRGLMGMFSGKVSEYRWDVYKNGEKIGCEITLKEAKATVEK